MKEFTYTITDPVGIHARPAGLLAKGQRALRVPSPLSRVKRKLTHAVLWLLWVLASSAARPSPFGLRVRTKRQHQRQSRHSLQKTSSDFSHKKDAFI